MLKAGTCRAPLAIRATASSIPQRGHGCSAAASTWGSPDQCSTPPHPAQTCSHQPSASQGATAKPCPVGQCRSVSVGDSGQCSAASAVGLAGPTQHDAVPATRPQQHPTQGVCARTLAPLFLGWLFSSRASIGCPYLSLPQMASQCTSSFPSLAKMRLVAKLERGSGEKRRTDLPQEGPSVSASVALSYLVQIIPDVVPGALPEYSTAQWVARASERTRVRASEQELHKCGAF